jgi:hypothetical protein
MKKVKILFMSNKNTETLKEKIEEQKDNYEIYESSIDLQIHDFQKSWTPQVILIESVRSLNIKTLQNVNKKYPNIPIVVIAYSLNVSSQKELFTYFGADIFLTISTDVNFICFTLENIALRYAKDIDTLLPVKNVLNPFNLDIRLFKIFLDFSSTESIMDFGIWFYDHYSCRDVLEESVFNKYLEFFYLLMKKRFTANNNIGIIIEESEEEFYIIVNLDTPLIIDARTKDMFQKYSSYFIIKNNTVYTRLHKKEDFSGNKIDTNRYIDLAEIKENKKEKKVKVIQTRDKEILKQSFIDKTSAKKYIVEIGGDVLDEILDLSSIEREWIYKLKDLEDEPSLANIIDFADSVLYVYTKALNNLFEFTSLAHALSSLSTFLKESADTVCSDAMKMKTLLMLLGHLGSDLASWREHIFVLQDTMDIHYLDSSFFSSCIQIEGIIGDKEIDAHDDDIEFF